MKATIMTILISLPVICVWVLVMIIRLDDEHSSAVQTNQRIEPTVITKCSNGNCDTTYVYDFNAKEK